MNKYSVFSYIFFAGICLVFQETVADQSATLACDEKGLKLFIVGETVTLGYDGELIQFGPLISDRNIRYYSKTRPGSDDERIVTAIWFRLDQSTGELVYLRDPEGGEAEFIHTRCTKSGTP
jgi:hypothetical protein